MKKTKKNKLTNNIIRQKIKGTPKKNTKKKKDKKNQKKKIVNTTIRQKIKRDAKKKKKRETQEILP